MRIRQVRPEFWKDDVMADLSSEVRLFYIGLWGVADDAGWIEWNTARISADLYPFVSRGTRERNVTKWAATLQEVGRIVVHPCGCVEIPRLPEHQKNGGNKVTSALDNHLVHTSLDKSIPSTDKSARANNANPTGNPLSLKGGPGGNALAHVTDAVLTEWAAATGRQLIGSGNFAIDYMDDACRRHPESSVVQAIRDGRSGFGNVPSTQQLTAAVRAILDPLPSSKQVTKAVDETQDREASRRRVQATKARIHNQGSHADTPDPACDLCVGRAA